MLLAICMTAWLLLFLNHHSPLYKRNVAQGEHCIRYRTHFQLGTNPALKQNVHRELNGSKSACNVSETLDLGFGYKCP